MSKPKIQDFAEVITPEYTCPDGTVIPMKTIPPLLILDAQEGKGMPKPPKKQVKAGIKGGKMYIDDYEDPNYIVSMDQYKQAQSNKLIRVIILKGIDWKAVEIDPEEREELEMYCLEVRDSVTENDIRFYWLSNRLPDVDSMTNFQEAAMSLSFPTEEGIAESEEQFPSDDKAS